MGKTIVSWSPIHGQAGTTSNIASLASTFSLQHPSSNLITNTQLRFSTLDSLYGKELIADGFSDSGITALERLVKSNLLKSDAVMDYTETIYSNRLEILGGMKDEHVEMENLMDILILAIRETYDFLWIDAHAGSHNNITNRLLADADIVLVNLPQNRYILDRFFGGELFPDVLKGKPYVILISNYDESLSLTTRKIKRSYKAKYPIFPIHYSSGFKNASNELSIAEFFHRNQKITRDNPNYAFIRSLADVHKHIVKTTGFGKDVMEDDEE